MAGLDFGGLFLLRRTTPLAETSCEEETVFLETMLLPLRLAGMLLLLLVWVGTGRLLLLIGDLSRLVGVALEEFPASVWRLSSLEKREKKIKLKSREMRFHVR